MPSFDTTVNNWLSLLKIRVSLGYISRQLQTHPDYPSLLSITDTLEELSIEHAAIQIEKKQLTEIPVPFLTHLISNGGEWVMVKDRDNLDKQFPRFFERWKGTVLAAEKTTGWTNKENEKMLAKEQRLQIIRYVGIGLIALLAISGLLLANSLVLTALLLTETAGIFISWIIVSKDLGIESKLADQVCGDTVDCNAVIKSNGATLPGGLSWGDIGLTWFSFQAVVSIIATVTAASAQIINQLSFFSIFYIPFSFFSVFYQWRIAKKWCRLCLMVVGILLTQVVLLLPQLIGSGLFLPNAKTILLTAFVFSITVIAWLSIKWLLKNNHQLQATNWGLQRFRNNGEIFISQLKKQRKVDATPWKNDLQLGDPDAATQILVACNPYCGPCAHAHKILNDITERNNAVGITVRYTINAADHEDKKTRAIEYLLQLISEKQDELSGDEMIDYKRELLHDWFLWMDIKKFEARHPLKRKADVRELLLQHDEWSKEANINATPTLFVNGYELPKSYRVNDLPDLVRGVKTISEENIKQPAPALAI